jgi:hypothetical protein
MNIEFQIDAQRFLQAFRNNLIRNAPCSPQPFSLDIGSCAGQQVFLDRISVIGASTLVRTEIGAIHVVQDISIFLTPVAALVASDAQPGTPCWSPTIKLEFALSATVEGGTPSLCVTFLHVQESPGVTGSQALILGGFIASQFPATCTPFDLSAMAGALGEVPTAAVADISADVALTRLAIRLELEPVAADSASQWQSFLAGSIKPNPNADAWSLFVDGKLPVQAAVARIMTSLEEPIDNDNFDLESGPSGTFLVNLPSQLFPFPGPGVSIAFSGEAIDACVCFWDEIDLDIDISLVITFSVPQPNSVRMSLMISWDLSDLEVACCAFTAAIFWGFIGTNLLKEEKINWGEFLGGLVAVPLTFTIAVTQAHDKVANFIDLGDDWDEITDTVYQRTDEVSFPNSDLGAMTLTQIVGAGEGMVLSGSLGPAAVLENAELAVLKGEWSWGADDLCSSDPKLEARLNVSLSQKNGGFGSNAFPLSVCRAEILPGSDPLSQFPPYLKVSDTGLRLAIPLDSLDPAYLAAPYAAQVILVTNGGVRILTIPPIPILSQEEIDAAFLQIKLLKPVNCKDWSLLSVFWKGERFDPFWMVDPPPDYEIAQLWQLVISGLNAAQRVKMLSPEGELLAIAGHLGDGAAYLSALVSPAEGAIGIQMEELSPKRLSTPRRAASDTEDAVRQDLVRQVNPSITIRQSNLLITARIRLREAALDAAAGYLDGRSMLAVVSGTGVQIWDIRNYHAPRLARIERLSGLRGVLFDRRGLVVWGHSGVMRLDVLEGRFAQIGDSRPVEGLGRRGRSLYVATAEGLSIHADGTTSVQTKRPVSALTADRSEIATIEEDRVVLRRTQDFGEAVSVSLSDPLSVVPIVGRSGVFAATTQTPGTFVIQRGRDGLAAIREHYSGRMPWFAQRMRSGKTLLRLDRAMGEITLYRNDRSVTVVR